MGADFCFYVICSQIVLLRPLTDQIGQRTRRLRLGLWRRRRRRRRLNTRRRRSERGRTRTAVRDLLNRDLVRVENGTKGETGIETGTVTGTGMSGREEVANVGTETVSRGDDEVIAKSWQDE